MTDPEMIEKALLTVANRYACDGFHESDLIAHALKAVADEINSLRTEPYDGEF